MHKEIINVGIQLIPIHTELHPYEWIDAVIDIIRESGLQYEVGPFNSSIEGTYEEVTNLVNQINDFLYQEKCYEWLLNVQYQVRSGGSMRASEKTGKFRAD